ncbi:hypothetical protein Aperf_G00000007387 [Anoplocephala perfoliata]
MRILPVIILLLALGIGLMIRYWPKSCLCHISGRLDGKVALVTDGTSFMGQEIIAELARRGATVLVGSQNEKRFNTVHDTVLRLYGEKGERVNLDFADQQVRKDLTPIKASQLVYTPMQMNSLKAMKTFPEELMNKTNRLDFLINNAAMSHGPYGITIDNYESTMAIGHLAHYLLTEQLLPLLKKTKPAARIIIITSAEHSSGSFKEYGFFVERHRFNSIRAFSQVKLANVIHAVILGQKLNKTSVTPVSVDPGYVLPDFGVYIPSILSMFFKTNWEAGQAVLYTMLAPDIKPGGYYSNCELTEPSAEARDKKIIKFVKQESDRLTKVGK